MTVSVDVSFDTSREGLDFHDFFEQHCAGRVRVFMFDEEDAILSLADYHNGCSQPRSMQAYCVCEAWLCHKVCPTTAIGSSSTAPRTPCYSS